MRVKKEHLIASLIIILFVLLLLLPNIVNLITSEEIKYKVNITITVLVFLFLIYSTYDDIRKRKFTTTVYIVALDIIQIINFITLCYTFLIYSNETSIEIMLHKNNIHIVSLLVLLCISLMLSYLKSEKFIKKK